jgi:HAD superfamily hydrolase (TIGR01509 family)
MLKNISAVIFDMDGVIIDSEPIHFKLERQMFEDLGFSLTTEEHESFLGTNGFEMFNRLKARFGFTDPVETLVEEERTRYLRELESGRIPAVPGVMELIAVLSEAGVLLAVASSAPHEQIDMVLKRYGIAQHFEVRVSGDDVPRSKPNPGIFLRTAELLRMMPKECVVVEDSAAGVGAARAAGMRCIAFDAPASPTQDLSGADVRVESMEDIRRLLIG